MMDNQEARRVTVIEQALEGKFKNHEAAQLLGRSIRQVQRLKKRAKAEGSTAVLHGNRNRRPHNRLGEAVEVKVLNLARGQLEGCNYLHMRDTLEDEMGIAISYSCLRRLLKQGGIHTPMAKRRPKKHRTRQARACFGELVQLDASKYDWFSDGHYAYLHAAIDDATNQVLALYFTPEETWEAYCELVFQINHHQGLPQAFYADGRSIFFYDQAKKHKLSFEEQLSGVKEKLPQFARACQETGIALIHAHSAQAKGLVERLWGSLQNRLPKDFLRLGIHSIEQANRYLPRFIQAWNRRHAHPPANPEPGFLPKLELNRLQLHFAIHENRILTKGLTFSFQNKTFVFSDRRAPLSPGESFTLAHSKYCPLQALIDHQTYAVHEFSRVPVPVAPKLSPTQLAEKRSEWGRMGRQASPFRKPLPDPLAPSYNDVGG